MRRGHRCVGALVLAVAAGLAVGGAVDASQAGERITAYDVAVRVEATGDMVVTEGIDYDFGTTPRHGIYRDVPVRLRYDDRHDRVYPLTVLSVAGSPGTPDGYELESAGSFRRIRIGDPDRTITGAHRYTISYRVEAALNGFPEHDELYWNAIGAEWSVPVERATVRVEVPAAITDVACFSGPYGSSLPCQRSDASGAVATFAHDRLRPSQALTVVVGFPKGAVPSPDPVLDERWSLVRAFEVTPLTALGSLGLLGAVVAVLGRLVWRTGRDRRFVGSPVDVAFGSASGEDQAVPLLERPPTPVELAPPDDLRAGLVGTLVDEAANPLDVTATIVDLAVRGYLRIEEIPKKGWFGKADWTLSKLRDASGLRPYEALLADSLFEDGEEVRLSALRNRFAARLREVQHALYDEVVALRWFSARPDAVRTRWRVGAVLLLVLAAGLAVLTAAFTHLGLLALPLVAGALGLVVAAGRMPRRTAKGTGTLRRVQGFRRFIEESEAERARFAERQHLFSEYLPYAVVFGCTERWARAFAGLDGRLPDTPWYAGPDGFTAVTFADSLDGFAVTTSGTIASTPSGSGSSGFSGGSSGGGGGGGGGGSW